MPLPALDARPNRLRLWGFSLVMCLGLFASWSLAQSDPPEDIAGPTAVAPEGAAARTPAEPAEPAKPPGVNLFKLLFQGGLFMLPILAISLLTATLAVERFFGLRRDRILPRGLITELTRLGAEKSGFDPRAAYRICQRHPSPASTVLRAMLLKIGRPQEEVEQAVKDSSQREADRAYANVRWLNLAASLAPLLGLLGTVWGMIRAFHDTTHLPPGADKADHLAEGIYVALVTTLSGLIVAIPAAVFSHHYEGRIINLFHQISELLANITPQVERFEGRLRFAPPGAEDAPPPPPRV